MALPLSFALRQHFLLMSILTVAFIMSGLILMDVFIKNLQIVIPGKQSRKISTLWAFSHDIRSFSNKTDASLQKLISGENTRNVASSGYLFTGDRVRQFGDDRRKFNFIAPEVSPIGTSTYKASSNKRSCTKWAVVTTIHEPSEAVRRMLYLINRPSSAWCMVIVGDLELPSSYEFVSTLANHKNVIFLSSDEQRKLSHLIGVAFLDSLPWHSFGRKNVGFAYALAQNPTPVFIWDFDDDNQLKFWIDHANVQDFHSLDYLVSVLSSSSDIKTLSVDVTSYRHSLQLSKSSFNSTKECNNEPPDIAFNPYPVLGCPLAKCWPRGFPPSQVEETDFSTTYQSLDSEIFLPQYVKPASISIVQSLADHKPDVDAVFRMKVNNQPFSFEDINIRGKRVDKLLIIPRGLVVPMNAQATLHARSSFFGLYLPWTVNGRVSDIWRSYIAQAIFSLTSHVVAFAPLPLVDQDRNTDHGPMADFDAEIQLYLQVDALIKRLHEWKSRQYIKFSNSSDFIHLTSADYFTQNLAALVEDLYIDLYERQFVEEGDVISVQHWLHLLACYGHIHYKKAEKCQIFKWNVGIQPVTLSEKLKHFAQSGNPEGDYTVSTCSDHVGLKTPNLTLLNIDLHDGSRLDIPTLLASLGYRTILAGHKGKRTSYPKAHTRRYSASKKLLIQVEQTMSEVINKHRSHNAVLNASDIEENYDFYTHEGHNLINQIDVFTASFPPSMFQLWKPFVYSETEQRRRCVILAAAHRYNMARCSVAQWKQLNDDITGLLSSLTCQNVAGGMSRYDLEYMYHYTGITKAMNGYTLKNKPLYTDNHRSMVLHLLPAISSFYTRPEVEMNYENLQKRNTLLTFIRGRRPFVYELNIRFNFFRDKDIHVVDVRRAYSRYQLSDLTQYGAILYYPYSVMSYKFTELYSLNIPLMVPSMKYFRDQSSFGYDRTITGKAYCKDEQLGFDMPKASNSVHQYNPNIMSDSKLHYGNETNNENKQHELYWLQFSDFYDWPHVTYFDNATHAADMFMEFTITNQGEHLSNIRKLIEEENKMRRYFTIAKTWCPLLNDIYNSIHVTNRINSHIPGL